MVRAAQASGIPLHVLYSIGLTETGAKGVLAPFAMNIDGAAIHSNSLADALAKLEQAQMRGAKYIDVGCMQINLRFHGANFVSPAEMFDPRKNVDYAAGFLKKLREREGSWTLAVARYNAGPNNASGQKRYVCSVVANIVSSGFGSWTDSAKEFCR